MDPLELFSTYYEVMPYDAATMAPRAEVALVGLYWPHREPVRWSDWQVISLGSRRDGEVGPVVALGPAGPHLEISDRYLIRVAGMPYWHRRTSYRRGPISNAWESPHLYGAFFVRFLGWNALVEFDHGSHHHRRLGAANGMDLDHDDLHNAARILIPPTMDTDEANRRVEVALAAGCSATLVWQDVLDLTPAEELSPSVPVSARLAAALRA